MNYVYILALIAAMALADRNVIEYLLLKLQELQQKLSNPLMRLRLEWGIFVIRYNRRKYDRIVKKIIAQRDSHD